MASLDEQLHHAVLAALNPGHLQSEGLHFLQQLRQNPKEAWQAGLMSFLAGSPAHDDPAKWVYKYPGETRLFGLQLVDAMLQLPASSDEDAALVRSCCETARQQVWDYIHREFVQGPGEPGLAYLRNKLVQTVFLIFFQSYPTTWPDFFSSFADLLRKHPQTHAPDNNIVVPLNPRTTDLYLRLLHEISTELSDALLRLNKPHSRLQRDSELRDAVRENDAARIAKETFGIVAEALESLGKDQDKSTIGLYGKPAQECLEMGIRVVEDYVSWIDISLIVTPTWIPFLYQSLRLPHLNIRLAAADALICIVTKGMPPSNRIQLYNLLGLVDVLQALKNENNSRRQTSDWTEDEDQFNERLAKILNGMGVELCKICDDGSAPLDVRSSSLILATQLLPLLLSFVEEEVFASCSAVLQFSSAILSRYKKDKKMAPDSHMSDDKRSFLCQLLQRVVLKIRFPPDEVLEWEPPALPGDTEDEDLVIFLDRRRQLKTVVDAIACIDESMFQETIDPLISNILDKMGGGPEAQELPWQEVELAMLMLYNYSEAVKGSGPTGPKSYVLVPPEEIKKFNKNRDYKINYSQYPLSSLGALLLKSSKSSVTKYPHPSIAIQWFECVVRYHEFFELFPDVIQEVLPAFLDDRGLHHPNLNIRYRCCYLFYRFIAQGKPAFQTHLNPEAWQAILDQLQDLIVIQAQLPAGLAPSGGTGGDTDLLAKAALSPSMFDGQLYLFEASGIFVSFFSANQERQMMCLQKIIQPLVAGMRTEIANPPVQLTDLTNALNIHHCIMAVGAIAKGFPHLPSNNSSSNPDAPQWVNAFKTATDDIMNVTNRLNDIRVIRDATRSSFNKIVATIGMEALPHVPVLISCLLEKLTKPELVEFLSFVGQLVHKYKEKFGSLLNSLLIPLFSKIVLFLDQPVTGTDDIVGQSELRRAYFNLFNSIINAQMHMVFISSNNQPHLEEILKTIIHQMQAKEVMIPDLRSGFGVLKNFSSTWLKPVQSTEPSPVAGFEIFLYNQVVPLCFGTPVRPQFDWSDAESYLVLAEIAALLKMILTARGDEFVQFLMGTLFPSMSCPPEKGETLIRAIQETTDAKPSRKPLMEFFGRGGTK